MRSLTSSEDGWREVPVGFRVSWRDVDQSIFDMASGFAGPVAFLGRTGRSALGHIVRAGRAFGSMAVVALQAPGRFMRWSLAATLAALQAVFAVAALLAWRYGDIVRLRMGKLRDRVAAGHHRVIRLGERRAGAQRWNLIINLNVEPRADGLGGSAWIDRPVEA